MSEFKLFAKGTTPKVYFNSEGNEAGVKTLTNWTAPGGPAAGSVLDGELTINDDEGRTIYFALTEYKQNLEKSLRESFGYISENARIENELFLHEALMKVNALLFNLMVNFDEGTREVVQAWLNV